MHSHLTSATHARPLYEQYRPTNWADVVGQTKTLTAVERLRQRGGLAGRAYWLSGPSGTGKTTIARLIAAEVSDPFNVEELDAGQLTPTRVETIERESRCYGLGERFWASLHRERGTRLT